MAISGDALKNVLKDGHFKSVEEVHGNGVVLVAYRKKVSELAFGHDTNELGSRDMEKYGYLGHLNMMSDSEESAALSQMYRNTIIHFKKENLRGRVTYTYNDSLGGIFGREYIAGSDGSNVRISGISSYRDRAVTILDALAEATDEELRNPNSMAFKFGSPSIEFQYHGDVFSSGIENVCFTNQPPEDLVSMLKERGIGVILIENGKETAL